jgi:hypothetical protein
MEFVIVFRVKCHIIDAQNRFYDDFLAVNRATVIELEADPGGGESRGLVGRHPVTNFCAIFDPLRTLYPIKYILGLIITK